MGERPGVALDALVRRSAAFGAPGYEGRGLLRDGKDEVEILLWLFFWDGDRNVKPRSYGYTAEAR